MEYVIIVRRRRKCGSAATRNVVAVCVYDAQCGAIVREITNSTLDCCARDFLLAKNTIRISRIIYK